MPKLDFEQVFARLPSPYMVLDENLCYVAANPAYERVTMRAAKDFIGGYIFDEFPNEGESGRRLKESFERVLATGEDDSIAYIPYDIPRPAELGGGFERRFWTAHHSPILDEAGKVRFIVQNTVDVTDLVRLREAETLPFSSMVQSETRLLERARDAETRQRALLAESEEFRRLFQQAPGFIAILSGPDHVFTFANDSYLRLVGDRAVLGRPVGEALPEIVGQGFIEMLDGVYATGRPTGGQETRIMLQRAPGEAPSETFLDFSYDAIRDRHGSINGVFVQGMDRTEAVKTAKRQRALLDELNHRVKNTLATVQSLAGQTFRYADDPKAATHIFEGRLAALSHVHNLLSASEWSSAQLSRIIEIETRRFESGRVATEGPAVALGPQASIGLAMIIHELVSNAQRHGALSVPAGRVEVKWQGGDAADLALTWSETGGPAAAPPSRTGLGSRMIERVVTGELRGRYDCAYDPGGFRCDFTVPATSFGIPE